MKSCHAVAVTAILGLLIGAVSLAQPVTGARGHWEGSIDVPGQPLAISVDLDNKSDVWNGTITIPSQNVMGLPLADVTVKDDAVGFRMKGVPGDPTFNGKVDAQARTLRGELTQGGATLPFALSWKGEPRIEAPPKSTKITSDLEGSWKGTLSVGTTQLRLVLKLSNDDQAARGEIVSIDQGGAQIPISQIVQDGAKLTIAVSTIGARFQGELKAATIAGTWMQGAQSFPLTFSREP